MPPYIGRKKCILNLRPLMKVTTLVLPSWPEAQIICISLQNTGAWIPFQDVETICKHLCWCWSPHTYASELLSSSPWYSPTEKAFRLVVSLCVVIYTHLMHCGVRRLGPMKPHCAFFIRGSKWYLLVSRIWVASRDRDRDRDIWFEI